MTPTQHLVAHGSFRGVGYTVALRTRSVLFRVRRRVARFACPKGHDFEVPFSDDAELPPTWECRLHGTESKIIDGVEPEIKKIKPPRTHWDMLLERRSIPELEELLDERLEELRGRRTRTA